LNVPVYTQADLIHSRFLLRFVPLSVSVRVCVLIRQIFIRS